MTDVLGNRSFTALVEFQVRTETTTNSEWLDVWSPRGEDALVGEPQTTAYAAATSIDSPQNILIFERYANGRDSLTAHMERPAHEHLHATMGERNMTKRRTLNGLFGDIENYGWWSRPERLPTLSAADLQLTLICTRFPTDAMREQYLALTGAHADYCRAAEPDTLIYSGGLALADNERGPEIKAGDLLFVAVFADEAAATKHRDDPQHLALQPKLAAVERERVFVKSYRTTGAGYLWAPPDREAR